MRNRISIPAHSIPPEVLNDLRTSIEAAVSRRVSVRVKSVTIESYLDDDGEPIIKVIVQISKYPKEKTWMHDIITSATGVIRNSGISGTPLIDAHA